MSMYKFFTLSYFVSMENVTTNVAWTDIFIVISVNEDNDTLQA